MGKYDFPGGFIEYNEDPYAACIREVMEETGVRLHRDELQLFSAYTQEYLPNISVTDLLFIASSWHGDFTPADDVDALEWKPIAFTSTTDFAPAYPGLAQKLHDFSKSPL
jgi:ADP-ribose pyrophosphatase YjhB (NUDIX family)